MSVAINQLLAPNLTFSTEREKWKTATFSTALNNAEPAIGAHRKQIALFRNA
jgi:hypothetical protein